MDFISLPPDTNKGWLRFQGNALIRFSLPLEPVRVPRRLLAAKLDSKVACMRDQGWGAARLCREDAEQTFLIYRYRMFHAGSGEGRGLRRLEALYRRVPNWVASVRSPSLTKQRASRISVARSASSSREWRRAIVSADRTRRRPLERVRLAAWRRKCERGSPAPDSWRTIHTRPGRQTLHRQGRGLGIPPPTAHPLVSTPYYASRSATGWCS